MNPVTIQLQTDRIWRADVTAPPFFDVIMNRFVTHHTGNMTNPSNIRNAPMMYVLK